MTHIKPNQMNLLSLPSRQQHERSGSRSVHACRWPFHTEAPSHYTFFEGHLLRFVKQQHVFVCASCVTFQLIFKISRGAHVH